MTSEPKEFSSNGMVHIQGGVPDVLASSFGIEVGEGGLEERINIESPIDMAGKGMELSKSVAMGGLEMDETLNSVKEGRW